MIKITEEHFCDICGKNLKDKNNDIILNKSNIHVEFKGFSKPFQPISACIDYNEVCHDCIEKIYDFIVGLKRK